MLGRPFLVCSCIPLAEGSPGLSDLPPPWGDLVGHQAGVEPPRPLVKGRPSQPSLDRELAYFCSLSLNASLSLEVRGASRTTFSVGGRNVTLLELVTGKSEWNPDSCSAGSGMSHAGDRF